ncbi:MAG: anti-sigma factor [Opitutaceae bacterium]|nr:anti-sigma factor [Opitutaceae bacterium]
MNDSPPPPLSPLAWLPWVAAAGFALLAGFLGQAYFSARSEIQVLRVQSALADMEGRSLQQRLEAERILSSRRISDLSARLQGENGLAGLTVVPLVFPSGSTPPALAVAVWDSRRQEGMLSVSQLPAPAADRDYQLWIVDPQYPDPINAGVFATIPGADETQFQFKPDRPIKTAARFTVTVERKGGVPRSEGPVVLSSQ